MLYVGDAHACQGDGEVNLSALETAARTATLRVELLDGPLERPRAETDEHVITLAFADDLDDAVALAVHDMIAWIAAHHGLSRAEAYSLCSLAADVGVTQVVNRMRGAHTKVRKAVFA
jgi:acetamidase/formamidase